MTKVNIPEGTEIEQVTRGGETALLKIINSLNEKSFDGYVKVKRKIGEKDITSYIIFKDSEPKLGVREVVSIDEKEPSKKLRKLYAGEKTLKDVKNDSFDKSATIELHSGVDVESIITRYSKGKKKNAKGLGAEGMPAEDSRRIGLFWGGKEEEETLTREVCEEKLRNWRSEGYDVTELEAILPGDLNEVKEAFASFEDGMKILEGMASELEILAMSGFEEEIKSLRSRLKSPSQIPELKAELKALQDTINEGKDAVNANICLICGFPIRDETKCPRCGAASEIKTVRKEEEKAPGVERVEAAKEVGMEAARVVKVDGIELLSGHSYLIEEEKLKRSLKLFVGALNNGYKGFCITRTNPKHFKGKKDLTNTDFVWLTDKDSAKETTIPPSLERIMYKTDSILHQEENACLIFDGIEYLVSSNSFDAVLRFIRRLVDEVSESKSILLVTVSPYTLKEQQLRNLEREMDSVLHEET